eukprot:gb/GFBE01014465.1/.p1 GENE.gb/GFBE01014465.1/~~gb/GFBE01014465.1/.p1  ORF type:complete len:295 (+),score=9.02 gb/GFBE01014465.1/:1-885(+)
MRGLAFCAALASARVSRSPVTRASPGLEYDAQCSQAAERPEVLDRSLSPELGAESCAEGGSAQQQRIPSKDRPRTAKIHFTQVAGLPQKAWLPEPPRAARCAQSLQGHVAASAYRALSPGTCRASSPMVCRASSPPSQAASPMTMVPIRRMSVIRAKSPGSQATAAPCEASAVSEAVVGASSRSPRQPMDFVLPGSGSDPAKLQRGPAAQVVRNPPARVRRVSFSTADGIQQPSRLYERQSKVIGLAGAMQAVRPVVVRPSRAQSDVGLGAGKALPRRLSVSFPVRAPANPSSQ